MAGSVSVGMAETRKLFVEHLALQSIVDLDLTFPVLSKTIVRCGTIER